MPVMTPQLIHIDCPHPQGQHRMACWVWGAESAAHVLVAVHGLTRQGRDFDRLAEHLIAQAKAQGRELAVLCPDVVGRGRSDWLPDAMGYQLPQYAADMLALLAWRHARTPIARLDWVGTSMGGLIGMVMAGQPQLPLPCPIARLVLNDVGPAVTWASIELMQAYVGRFGVFPDLAAAAAAMRQISAGFGPLSDEAWLALSRPMVREVPGGVTLHYDPAIGDAVRAVTPEAAEQGQAMLWALYDQIQARTLLIRGAESNLLTPETALEMTQRGPRAQLVTWPGVGHAPTLTEPMQMAQVADFLLG